MSYKGCKQVSDITCAWGNNITNEGILLYEKSVGINKWLKSCGDQNSIVVMNLWRKGSILVAVIK